MRNRAYIRYVPCSSFPGTAAFLCRSFLDRKRLGLPDLLCSADSREGCSGLIGSSLKRDDSSSVNLS